MLIYAKNPNAFMKLAGYRVYGRNTGYPPRDVPFELYQLCKNSIEDGTYREGYLSKLFNKPFPEVAFTYSELRHLPEQTLDKIGPLMIEDYDLSWSHKKKVDQIKLALRNESPPY